MTTLDTSADHSLILVHTTNRNRLRPFRLALLHCALLLGLTMGTITANAGGNDSVVSTLENTNIICDFGTMVASARSNAEISTNLLVLLNRIAEVNNESGDKEAKQAQHELLFVDDTVLVPLRGLTQGTNRMNLLARHCLWFIGNKADVTAMEKELKRRPKDSFVAPGVIHKDLAGAIEAVREKRKLPAGRFRVEGLAFNRQMSKAYVRIAAGGGAFDSTGWGLMFHRGKNGWELVWSKFEWIS